MTVPLSHRIYATLFSVIVAAAMFIPLNPDWRGTYGDNFPLSWYPMFASRRPAVERINYVIGLTPEGSHPVDVSWWSSGGFNQGRSQLDTAIRKQGRAAEGPASELCQRIARKLGRRRSGWASTVTEVEFRRGTFRRERWFGEGDRTPDSDRLVLRCTVNRAEAAP